MANHWRNVFAARGIDTTGLQHWIQEAAPTWASQALPTQPGVWRVRRKDVARAIRCARSTAPGPDGISALLWQRLGSLGADALYEAAVALDVPSAADDLRAAYSDEVDSTHNFNLGVLCCIPKKPVEHRPEVGDIFDADGTRPLTIVDVSNRIIAAAYKARWERRLGPWISPQQRGFLPGRSMLANVVDLEHHAMMAALSRRRGLLLLLDFKAAFPSVAHAYMQQCLEGFGVPPEALHVVRALYDGGRCVISSGGSLWPGFDVASGIRQGCPLAPLLFAAVMDLLLRVLARRLGPDVQIRAFADDVGLVLTDVGRQLPILAAALEEFGAMSGMQINLPKTVGIPLWDAPLEEASAVIAAAAPAWAALPLKRSGTYLGCVVGPDKTETLWSSASKRFRERVEGWPWSSMGLHFATVAYNVYALPVLAFTAQTAQPTQSVLELEGWALRRAAPGPGAWATSQDLWALGDHYGLPKSFGSVWETALAAQLRVEQFENAAEGGLRIEELRGQLGRALTCSPFPARAASWSTWFEAAVPEVLARSRAELRRLNIDAAMVLEELAGNVSRPWPAQTWDRVRKRFQGKVRRMIHQRVIQHPHYRIRHKLERWHLPGRPRVVADRFLDRLARLRLLAPPRVSAAVFSTAWNRWCTERRFQRRGGMGNVCRLGCGGRAEDSIEHYARCRTVRRFHASSLRIVDDWLLPRWLGTHDAQVSDDQLLLGALGAYAAYRTTNAARAEGALSEQEAFRALQQSLREAVGGHLAAERCLRELWAV